MTRKQLNANMEAAGEQQQLSDTPAKHLSYAGTGRKRVSSTMSDESQQQLCPQQRYVKRPKFPGMVTFDGGLRQLPLHRSRATPPTDILDTTAVVVGQTDDTETAEHLETTEEADLRSEISVSSSSAADDLARDNIQTSSERSIDETDLAFPFRETIQVSQDILRSPTVGDTLQRNNSLNRPKLGPIQTSAKSLRLEAMTIYTDLIRANIDKGKPINALPESATARDKSTWKALHGLRYALLPQSHDFKWASQSADAPHYLKRLAARYGVTARTAKSDIDGFMAPLYDVESAYWHEMFGLIDKSRLLLEKFEKTFPSSGEDMKLTNENLHHYFHVLKDSGLHGKLCYYQCQSYKDSARWTAWRAFRTSSSSSSAASHSLNDDLREWYASQYLCLDPLVQDEVDASYVAAGLPLDESMLGLLSGWLAFGPVVTNTFHEFCKLFKFLAWVGSSN